MVKNWLHGEWWVLRILLFKISKLEQANTVLKRKKTKKSLTRGHVEDIGSALGIQSYGDRGTKE